MLHPSNNFILFCAIILTLPLWGQDIHNSQFNRSPLNLNPALTGIFKGDTRFIGNYKDQWNRVPVSYMTFSGSVEYKFENANLKNSLFSVGFLFNHDEAGELELSLSKISPSGSYTHRIAEKHFLTGGVQVSFAQRRFDFQNLQVDLQYNGDTYDPSLPTGEKIDNSNIFFIDFSSGINYHYQHPEKRTRVDIGGAMFHINEPNTSFYEDVDISLSRRFSIYSISSFLVTEKIDIEARATGQFQGPHTEILIGLDGKIYLSQTRSKEVAVSVGLAYRWKDALAPIFTLDYHNWSFGYSYDTNISDFNDATNARGGSEISVIYIYSKVRPPKVFEICPIF